MMRKDANPDYVCVIPDKELRKRLTPTQYGVTREGATEQPFHNEYWNNHEKGIYVDVIDGSPLFSSTAKYESGTGWPSFWEPLNTDSLKMIEDNSYGMLRTEVRSASSGAHLGHVFNDGPEPTGLRFCMNSAALRFIPLADLEAEGLGAYLSLF